MKFPQNIMVIVSGEREQHVALRRAVQFAKFYDIQLHLFSCVYDPGTELSPLLPSEYKETLKQNKLKQRLEYLNRLKSEIESDNVPVTVEVKWDRRYQRAIIEACEQQKPDILVKHISRSATSLNPFIMPVDWQLLRQCPRPLLLVKDTEWNLEAPILAAVDASSEDPDEQVFNQKIIDYARSLGKLTGRPIHVITTHISPEIDNAFKMPEFNLEELREKVTRLNHDKLQSMLVDQDIASENQHVVEGLAEDKISEIAENINAQIVVMGTLGRRGIQGALMGNTAEKVLTQLRCEVLALRP